MVWKVLLGAIGGLFSYVLFFSILKQGSITAHYSLLTMAGSRSVGIALIAAGAVAGLCWHMLSGETDR